MTTMIRQVGAGLLTVDEAAALLRLSRSATYRLVAAGELRAVRLGAGPGARLRIPSHAVERFLELGAVRQLERRSQ